VHRAAPGKRRPPLGALPAGMAGGSSGRLLRALWSSHLHSPSARCLPLLRQQLRACTRRALRAHSACRRCNGGQHGKTTTEQ
jgi:hypothetical protein